jgi:drug/metabolite transporter (DMT)-like permease
MFAAITGWSLGTLVQKRAARPETALAFTCAQMIFGGVFQLLMSLVDREWSHFDVAQVSWVSTLAMLYLIVFGSLLTFNCYLWLLTRVPATKVTTYALVNPVVALFLGAIVLNERLTPLALAAAALVLVGVALVLFQDLNWLRNLRRREPAQEGATAGTRSR